ncbi:hypothetical protein GQ53DRAFT_61781 [Thozetella sp. PMI_491]|nr:hypothetical protein GQ53DRAFT_61781 [Thozetella sp. PMI_491]
MLRDASPLRLGAHLSATHAPPVAGIFGLQPMACGCYRLMNAMANRARCSTARVEERAVSSPFRSHSRVGGRRAFIVSK